MKYLKIIIFVFTFFICNFLSYADGYLKNLFKLDSAAIIIFKENQIGKNFLNAAGDDYYSYCSKLGGQLFCFQAGFCREKEFNRKEKYNDKYVQINSSVGVFIGLEFPITKKIRLGLTSSASFYSLNREMPIYIETSNKLLDFRSDFLYQTQFRFIYKLDNSFSILSSVSFNSRKTDVVVNNNLSNLYRLNLGFRYGIGHNDINDMWIKKTSKRRFSLFLGTQSESRIVEFPFFTITKNYPINNKQLLRLANTNSETSRTSNFATIGIMSKKKNILALSVNRRNFIQYSSNYADYPEYYYNTWRITFKDFSARITGEYNLFNLLKNDNFFYKYIPFIYPIVKTNITYNKKDIDLYSNFDNRNFVSTQGYYAKVNAQVNTEKIEINNYFGFVLLLNKLYFNTSVDIFSRSFADVEMQREATYYIMNNYSYNNILSTTKEILPVKKAKGWIVNEKRDTPTLVFTVGLSF
jgi:hypothetical protein